MTVDQNSIELKDNIANWLLSDGRRLEGLPDLLEGICLRLREASFPLDRGTLGVPIMHPIAQSSFSSWNMEEGKKENSLVWDENGLELLRNSPMHPIYTKGSSIDWQLMTRRK